MADIASGKLPRGYTMDQVESRQVIRCNNCGRRWWADRMTHWANEVFLVEHRERHQKLRRKRPENLPAPTRSLLISQTGDSD